MPIFYHKIWKQLLDMKKEQTVLKNETNILFLVLGKKGKNKFVTLKACRRFAYA